MDEPGAVAVRVAARMWRRDGPIDRRDLEQFAADLAADVLERKPDATNGYIANLVRWRVTDAYRDAARTYPVDPAGRMFEHDFTDEADARVSVDPAFTAALRGLSDAQRFCLVAHDVLGLPYALLAEEMGLSYLAVKQLRLRAVRAMRRALEEAA